MQWVLEVYPDRVKALFDALDLDRAGLQAVKAAVGGGDMAGACRALLDYYRTGESGKWLRGPAVQPGEGRDEDAEKLLDDTFTVWGRTARVPRTSRGGFDWTYGGPDNDINWAWGFNRQEYLPPLLETYRKTGHARYVRLIDNLIRDWVTGSLPYPACDTTDACWRGLETALRVKQWAIVFYALQQDSLFSDATRLLMLTSLPEHAHYLRHFHKGGGNWITTELSGLGLIAAAWPEFREAAAWQAYSGETLLRSMPAQVYPDGVQMELTSGYHYVSLKDFSHYADVCRDAGIPLPPGYRDWLEKMWNYLAYSLRPDGCGPLNNDSDLSSYRELLIKAARDYERPDWLYIATNGAQGGKPMQGPPLIFPWAGQVITRSGWGPEDFWAFFDIGPQGIGHSHCDKLHLSLYAHGRDLLVDSGRFTYAFESPEGRFQGKYAGLSVAHNVILIDDRGQAMGPGKVDRPVRGEDYLITPELTFARGTCDAFFEEIYSGRLAGRAAHTRAVVSLNGLLQDPEKDGRGVTRPSRLPAAPGGPASTPAAEGLQEALQDCLIIVADRIETDRPRKLDALWHWHPRCTVKIDGQNARSVDPGVGNLRIAPVAGFDWSVETVKGQEPAGIHGTMQGWYAHSYNNWEPSPASVYTARIERTTAFAWLLLPARGDVPAIQGEIVENTDDAIAIRIRRPGLPEFTVRIPWRGGSVQAVIT
jgi:hypothetical protein